MLLDGINGGGFSLRESLDDNGSALLGDLLGVTFLIESAKSGEDGQLSLGVNSLERDVVGLAQSSDQLLVFSVLVVSSQQAESCSGASLVGGLDGLAGLVQASGEVLFAEGSLANLGQGVFEISRFDCHYFRFIN